MSSLDDSPVGASRILDPFIDNGLFNESEIQLAYLVERLGRQGDMVVAPEVILAVAVSARGTRSGHVCVDLSRVADLLNVEGPVPWEPPWPDPQHWLDVLANSNTTVASPKTASQHPLRPLVLDGGRLYLQRYWIAEQRVSDAILRRVATVGTLKFNPDQLNSTLDQMFGPQLVDGHYDLQRHGAATALTQSFSVLAGGPGTGKTRTIARMLSVAMTLARDNGSHIHVGLAAPSGKAAARMGEAIESAVGELLSESLIDPPLAERLRSIKPVTIHHLLGSNPRRGFAHNSANPLSYDLVVVDETSMVSLPLMAGLLDAVESGCHVVLVGDPDQLASIQAGTVLGDIVRPAESPGPTAPTDAPAGAPTDAPTDAPAGAPFGQLPVAHNGSRSDQVTILRVARRFRSDSKIAELAESVRIGDTDETIRLLRNANESVTDTPFTDGTTPNTSGPTSGGTIAWVDPDSAVHIRQLVDQLIGIGLTSLEFAKQGDVAGALAALSSTKVLAATHHHQLGRIDWSERIESGLFKAMGPESAPSPWHRWYIGRPVMITQNDPLLRLSNGDVGVTVERDGVLVVALTGNPDDRVEIQTARLDQVETWWAMTIHKSQGSEFDHVIVSLPPANIPILTRELLYTAITRARTRVTIVGTEDAIRTGVDRPVSRASGLADRLWPALATATRQSQPSAVEAASTSVAETVTPIT